MCKLYFEIINKLLASGHLEVVPEDELEGTPGLVWRNPHHLVQHPKTLKWRQAIDLSAIFKGKSLNGQLLKGPDLINVLLGILIRFRKELWAFECDVESMFYQFRIRRRQRCIICPILRSRIADIF